MLKKMKAYQPLKLELHEVILDSGLRLLVLPRKGFTEKQVALSVPFGSITRGEARDGQTDEYPLGLAHFLEHKIFEGSDGCDVIEEFTALGLEANAYTSYQQTVYYFSTVNNINEGIDKLVNLVSDLQITEESIDKEKLIIQKELLMYEDDAEYQLSKGLLANLYPGSTLSEDIAGNVASVQNIGSNDLKRAYQRFYQWSQLTMVIVGDVDVDDVVNQVDESVKLTVNNVVEIETRSAVESSVAIKPVEPSGRLEMDVTQPKLGIGFRLAEQLDGFELQAYRVGLQLFLAMLFGWTSKTYQKWYEDGLIDYSFDFHLDVTNSFKYVSISLDTDQPIAMTAKIKTVLTKFKTSSDFSEDHLAVVKKEIYGHFIKTLDTIDHLAGYLTLSLADGEDYLLTGEIIRHMTLADVYEIADHFVTNMEATSFTIFPK